MCRFRDVAQPGLEYTSGGRGVASSNLAIPTKSKKDQHKLCWSFIFEGRRKLVYVSTEKINDLNCRRQWSFLLFESSQTRDHDPGASRESNHFVSLPCEMLLRSSGSATISQGGRTKCLTSRFERKIVGASNL